MRELHAALLRLADPGDADRVRVLVWASVRHALPALPADVDRRRGTWRGTADGGVADEVRWSTLQERDESLLDTTWWRPARTDPSLLTRTTVTVGVESDAAWVLVRTGLESVGSTVLEVAELPPEPVPLVALVVGKVRCVDAGRRVRADVEQFTAARVPELAAFVTATPSRALPVLVIDGSHDGMPAGDPVRVAHLLSGLAHVVTLGPGAVRPLAGELGPAAAVPEGGARLFWPRWRSDDRPGRHPAFERAELAAGGARPRFPTMIGRVLRLAAVTRVSEPAGLRMRLRAAEAARRVEQDRELRATRARERDRSRESDGAREGPTEGPEPATGDSELVELYEAELTERIAELHEARREAEDLSRRLRRAEEDLDRAISGLARTDGPVAAPPATLRDAVAKADVRAVATVFLPAAYDAAARVQSRDPARVYERLRRLDAVAASWQQGAVEGSLVQAMRAAGLDWAAGVSHTAHQQRSDEYRSTYRGDEIQLGPHLRLDSGLRVYCYLDDSRRVVVVGHVGAHLPGKRDT